MLFTELLKMAWRSLAANKLRAFLTMLGVIIGVTHEPDIAQAADRQFLVKDGQIVKDITKDSH